jgi:NAD(P)-dependent dehydrogenase (short-subunit alcohol dehydrogenase family)
MSPTDAAAPTISDLTGLAAVITGGGSGIGLAVARAFASAGMRVLIGDIEESSVERAVHELGSAGAEAYGQVVDVRDPDAMERLAAVADARLGGVQVLVNNAGIVRSGRSWELSLEEWRSVIDVNLWGVVHGIRSFVPRMIASGRPGHVVNMGSMASVSPRPSIAPYVASKHAVLGLSDSLRSELAAAGAPIGVTLVMPGLTHTPMTNAGSPADEVAIAVVGAILAGMPYLFPHPDRIAEVEARFAAIVGESPA